ncbi:MAG: hypothetical protein GX621_09205 [Pirellulaceae bacterium]|nr:hypothetical protein [Pirellulaceae bacterium]
MSSLSSGTDNSGSAKRAPISKSTARAAVNSFSICRDELMTLEEAGRRLRLGGTGMRQAQKAGMRTIKFGRMKYCLGSDILDFFERLAESNDG